jgi:hypothetical protein
MSGGIYDIIYDVYAQLDGKHQTDSSTMLITSSEYNVCSY